MSNKTKKENIKILENEKEKLLQEINNKIKKKKLFSDPDTDNEFLK